MNSEKTLKSKPKKRPFENLLYDFVRVTGALPAWIMLRPKFYYPFGKPKNKGAMIVASNHVSMLDPISVHMAFPLRHLNMLATNKLFDTKVKNYFFTKMHCIVANKENFNLSSFHRVVERLEAGKVVVIFPEGKINRKEDASLLSFKSGVVLMAHKAGASILPFYIHKREKWYRRQRIVVGYPLDIAETLGRMPTMQAVTDVTALLKDKESELEEYIPKKFRKDKSDNNKKG